MKKMRTNLNVPFAEKDKARSLGAKWDAARKTWYIEDVEQIERFMIWIPEYLKKPTKGSPSNINYKKRNRKK